MWTEVVFEGATSVRGIEMAYALARAGLVLNKDFIWTYIPKDSVVGLDETGYILSGRKVTIKFRDPSLATFYQLKWS